MWVDKDDVFAEDKVREFKASNPDTETHIRGSLVAKSLHPSSSPLSQLLYQHALHYMSSNGDNDFAQEYPAGAIADSPIPFSQEHPINTPVTVPVPIVDFTTLQPLSVDAPVFSPRPVTASSSALDVTAMFQQLRVHTPAPLTPDGQRAASQANEMFTVSFTPAERQGGQASSSLEPRTAAGSEATLGAPSATSHISRAPSYDSAADDDLRHCAHCGEQREYCHGHTPVIPNPSLDLPPNPPRLSVSRSVPPNGMARFNLSRVQATSLAAHLINSLEQNDQDTSEVPPAYDYGEEFARIIAEGLGIPPAVATKGLGIRSGGRQRQNRGRGGRPQQLPNAQCPANSPPAQASARRPARRPVSPTPAGFKHNQGPTLVPFRIQENSHEMPAHYIRTHLDAPNPFVEGQLSLQGPMYHSEIHAATVHNVDVPPPPITADILQLLHTDYMGHNHVDEALGELGDWSLCAEVNHYRWLERKRKSFQESIMRLEDQLFTCDIERRMCISRLEGARAMVCIQGEMQRNQQAFRLSPWLVERGCSP
jgi:hypothetical protein